MNAFGQNRNFRTFTRAHARRRTRASGAFAIVASGIVLAVGCEPKLVVGELSCVAAEAGAGGQSSDAPDRLSTDPVAVPWSTGFENGFCDYSSSTGYCYADKRAAYTVVSSPVHSGKTAAAFSLITDAAYDGLQARCVREGQLPRAAFYGAYFFIPSAPTAANNWNLIHLQRGDGSTPPGLWDISLAPQPDGTLKVYVFDFLRMVTRAATGVSRVPVGEWFELGVYWDRAADATGELGVYVNGMVALDLKGLSTDDSDYGQWYVGSLAVSLTPAEFTIYVDDVSIRDMP